MGAEDATFKVKIHECKLIVRKIRFSPSIFVAHAKALEMGNAKYPIRRAICKTFTVPRVNLDANQENLFSGQLPTRIVIGCVDNNSFNGAFHKNPFNFKHFNLTQLKLYLDGQQQSLKPIEPNFAANKYIMAYSTLFSGTGKLQKDEGIDITRMDYSNGYTLYAFDLTPDLAEGGHFNLLRQGNVRLELKFGVGLVETANVIVYSEFENIIEIDKQLKYNFRLQKLKMNAVQITKILQRKCGGKFLGVFAADEIPRNIRTPAIFFTNTDARGLPREHWIAIYFNDDGNGEFFDSFGRSSGPYFANYMDKHSSAWIYNDTQLQNLASTFCGNYCVFYYIYRCIGLDMKCTVNMFSRNTLINDYLVHKLSVLNKISKQQKIAFIVFIQKS